MLNFIPIKKLLFLRTVNVLLCIFCCANLAWSFQSATNENYLSSEIEVKRFDEGAWKNTVEGLDYSQQIPTDKKKKKEAEEPDDDGDYDRAYDEEEYHTPPTNFGDFWSGFFKFFLIALTVVILGFIIAGLVGAEGWSLAPSNKKIQQKDLSITLDNIEEKIHESDLDRFLREALEKENYPQAVRIYYLAIIKELSLKKWIKWKKDKTNRDYIRELSSTNFYTDFRKVTQVFERVWYGKATLEGTDFRSSVQPQLQAMLQDSKQATKKI